MKKKNKKSKSRPEVSKEPVKGPIALILAGYDKVDSETKKIRKKEIAEAYDPDELYFGQNKFLHPPRVCPYVSIGLNVPRSSTGRPNREKSRGPFVWRDKRFPGQEFLRGCGFA